MWDSPSGKKVVGVIKTRHPNTCQTLIGCVKKRDQNAAGTSSKYWGKWGSVGGTPARRAKHALSAICIEISDETGFDVSHHDVCLPGHQSKSKKDLMTLLHHQSSTGLEFFIFEMEFNQFISVFPYGGMYDAKLIKSSHGEIDAIGSFSTTDINQLQRTEIQQSNNNFFLGYFLDTFETIVIPCLSDLYPDYKKKWSGKTFAKVADTVPRQNQKLTSR